MGLACSLLYYSIVEVRRYKILRLYHDGIISYDIRVRMEIILDLYGDGKLTNREFNSLMETQVRRTEIYVYQRIHDTLSATGFTAEEFLRNHVIRVRRLPSQPKQPGEIKLLLKKDLHLEQDNETSEQQEQCTVCRIREGRIMIQPCGHAGFCRTCCSGHDVCFVCRTPIVGYQRYYPVQGVVD